MERQWQPVGNPEDHPAYFEHLHARHYDGTRKQYHDQPGVLFLHAHADLFLRQCYRNDSNENNLNICLLDTADISGFPGSQQHEWHLYFDLLYLQRQHAGRHKHSNGYSICPGLNQADDHGNHGNTGRW